MFSWFTQDYIDQTRSNYYLDSKQNYELLRARLASVNINFKCANAIDLSTHFPNKYDLILLSNVLDYFYKILGPNWQYDDLQKYIFELEKICKQNGIIFLNYIYELKKQLPLFSSSCIYSKDLQDQEIIEISRSLFAPSAVILKRVK